MIKGMITDLIYEYYYRSFMKENNKSEININWEKLEKLDKMCTKFSR